MGVTLLCLPSSIPSLTAMERESLGEATDEALSSSVHAKFISCHSPVIGVHGMCEEEGNTNEFVNLCTIWKSPNLCGYCDHQQSGQLVAV